MLMLTRSARLTVVGLLALSVCGEVHAQKVLRWKFEPDQTLRLRFDQKTSTETTGAGKPTGIRIAMQMGMNWHVDSVTDDGTAQITQQFESMQLSMKSGEADAVEYDSTSQDPPKGGAANIAAGVKPLLGAKFTVSVTPRGTIREVKVPDETTAALEDVDSATIKQLFSVEGITRILRQSAVELPEEAVSEGDSWQKNAATKTPLGVLHQTRTYAVAAGEESVEKIVVDTELKLEKSAAKMKLLDQAGSGTVLFDSEMGRITRSELTQEFTTERPYREFLIKVVTKSTSVMIITAD